MKPILASAASSWVHCPRRAWLDSNPPAGYETIEPDEFSQLVMTLGLRHEWAIKRQLEKLYQLVEAVSEAHTRALMEAGVQVIYQPQLSEGDIVGKPDFLIRQPSGQYRAADAKLARSDDKKEIQIQLGVYRRLLGNGLPASAYLGTGEVTEIGEESEKEVEKFLASMRQMLPQTSPPPARYSESKCKACGFNAACKPGFEAKGELTLVYGIDSRSAEGLERLGITTIKQLAGADAATLPDVPYLKGHERKQRAVLQAQSYLDGSIHRLKPIALPAGTWVHFDIEVNPLTESGREHVYLWGFLTPPYTGDSFDYVWTDSEEEDRWGWDTFLAKVEAYLARHPDLLLAHFSGYERQKISLYATRYAMHDHPVVRRLLGDDSILYDLRDVVRECLVLPLASYGLKYICKHPKLVNFQWEDSESGSQWSVVQYVNYLMSALPADRERIKNNILTYNLDDVMATRKLEEWLRNSQLSKPS